jgi:hypothetical protein
LPRLLALTHSLSLFSLLALSLSLSLFGCRPTTPHCLHHTNGGAPAPSSKHGSHRSPAPTVAGEPSTGLPIAAPWTFVLAPPTGTVAPARPVLPSPAMSSHQLPHSTSSVLVPAISVSLLPLPLAAIACSVAAPPPVAVAMALTRRPSRSRSGARMSCLRALHPASSPSKPRVSMLLLLLPLSILRAPVNSPLLYMLCVFG